MRRNSLTRFGVLALALGTLPSGGRLGAQPIPTIELKPANAVLAEQFTFITSIRELSSGRVLVTDEKENRLVAVDFDRQRVEPIGRIGAGPGEYRWVGRLWALGGDSTLMADPFSRRRFILHGSRIIATRSSALGITESGLVLGADRNARVAIAVHSLTPAGRLSGLRDSMFVLRIGPGSRTDTIARVPSEHADVDPGKPRPTLQLGTSGLQGGPRVYRVGIAWLDQALMFNDGSIAIARTRPYRVDWCAPAAASCTLGPAIPEPSVRAGDAEKRAFLRIASRNSSWPVDLPLSSVVGWPEYFPPFTAKVSRIDASPLFASPAGQLVIERLPTSDAPGLQYDIVDRRGVRVARLQLPANQHVVGFGARSIYIVVTDDDHLQRLQRHPWP